MRLTSLWGAVLGAALTQAASIPAELFNSALYTKFEAAGSAQPSAWPQYTNDSGAQWDSFDAQTWTSAFLPSSFHLLHRRHTLLCPATTTTSANGSNVDWLGLAREWSAGLSSDARKVGTMEEPETSRLWVLPVHLRHSVVHRLTILPPRLQIMDNMVNIQLLVLEASRGGSATLLDMATSHANKTLANHVRADSSSYHLVDYDPTTGDVMWRGTAQGEPIQSCAWGILGFATMYNLTSITTYLDTSRSLAQWYLDHLPTSGVAYWDFDAPLPSTLDTSASSVTSSALLLLSDIETRRGNSTGAAHWSGAAITLLSNLVEQGIDGWNGLSILGNGTVNNRASP
ncbi:hypothetical protein RQP46_001215 [Phenoliferia psychrophenolica]